MLAAREDRAVAVVIEPLRMADGAGEALEFGIVRAADHGPSVITGASIAALRRGVGAAVAHAIGQASVHLTLEDGCAHHRDGGFLFREIDVLALAGSASIVECGEHRAGA